MDKSEINAIDRLTKNRRSLDGLRDVPLDDQDLYRTEFLRTNPTAAEAAEVLKSKTGMSVLIREGREWPPPLPKIHNPRTFARAMTHKSFSPKGPKWTSKKFHFLGDGMWYGGASAAIYGHDEDLSTEDHTVIRNKVVKLSVKAALAHVYKLDQGVNHKFQTGPETDQPGDRLWAELFNGYVGALGDNSATGMTVGDIFAWIKDLLEPIIEGELPPEKRKQGGTNPLHVAVEPASGHISAEANSQSIAHVNNETPSAASSSSRKRTHGNLGTEDTGSGSQGDIGYSNGQGSSSGPGSRAAPPASKRSRKSSSGQYAAGYGGRQGSPDCAPRERRSGHTSFGPRGHNTGHGEWRNSVQLEDNWSYAYFLGAWNIRPQFESGSEGSRAGSEFGSSGRGQTGGNFQRPGARHRGWNSIRARPSDAGEIEVVNDGSRSETGSGSARGGSSDGDGGDV